RSGAAAAVRGRTLRCWLAGGSGATDGGAGARTRRLCPGGVRPLAYKGLAFLSRRRPGLRPGNRRQIDDLGVAVDSVQQVAAAGIVGRVAKAGDGRTPPGLGNVPIAGRAARWVEARPGRADQGRTSVRNAFLVSAPPSRPYLDSVPSQAGSPP